MALCVGWVFQFCSTGGRGALLDCAYRKREATEETSIRWALVWEAPKWHGQAQLTF